MLRTDFPTPCTIRWLTGVPKCYCSASHYWWTLQQLPGSSVGNMKQDTRLLWRQWEHCSWSGLLCCDWQKFLALTTAASCRHCVQQEGWAPRCLDFFVISLRTLFLWKSRAEVTSIIVWAVIESRSLRRCCKYSFTRVHMNWISAT